MANSAWQIGKSKGFKLFQICFLVFVFFPALASAMNLYKTYSSTKNPNYTFKYLDDSADGITDAENCARQSLNMVIKCTVDGNVSFFGGVSYTSHYYWKGRIVDNELDQVAEQIYLNGQAMQVEQAKSKQRNDYILLGVGILVLMSVIGFICYGCSVAVVFSSVLDLLLIVGIPILGGVIVFLGKIFSDNGHMYGVDFSNHSMQVFLLVWFSLWIIWNAIQSFRYNNVFLALFVLASRITTPIFIVIIWSWVTSAIDRFLNHGCKK